MANITEEAGLLAVLKAMHVQRGSLQAAIEKILERCITEHTGRCDVSSFANEGVDVEMKDRDVERVADTGNGHDAAKTLGDARLSRDVTHLCRTCYDDLLTVVRNIYAGDSSRQPQWAKNSPNFLGSLDRMLEDARSLRISLAQVDFWLTERKRVWLVDELRRDVAVKVLGEARAGASAAYQACLADASADDAALVALLHFWVAKHSNQVHNALTAVRNLTTAAVTTAELSSSAIYRDIVFPDGVVPDVPEARLLLARLAESSVNLAQVLREALESGTGGHDNEDARVAKAEKHTKRLAELRRAKAAHEAQKLKRMKPVEVPDFLQGQTVCATCSTPSDPRKSHFCIVCFLEVDYWMRENQTVWCSVACMKENYAAHHAEQHHCAAGDRCARARPETPRVETPRLSRGVTVRQEPRYCFCRECVLSFSIRTVYCNDRCAGRDFQRHREAVHLPHRALRADSRDDRGDLSFSSAAQVDYTAVDIAKHVLPLAEALEGCKKKHPDWTLSEATVRVVLPWETGGQDP